MKCSAAMEHRNSAQHIHRHRIEILFFMFDFVTNWRSGFEISLMRMPYKPYKALQHSYDVFFVARGFQMQAVRFSQDGA